MCILRVICILLIILVIYTCGTCYTYYIESMYLTYDTVIRIVLTYYIYLLYLLYILIIPTILIVLIVLLLLHTNLTYNLQHVGSPFCSKTLHPTPEKKKKTIRTFDTAGNEELTLGTNMCPLVVTSATWRRTSHDIVEKTMVDRFRPVRIPPKTNMSPENQWLEDVFPIKIFPFKGTC